MGSIASYAYNLVVHSGVYVSLSAMSIVITVLAVLNQPLYPITLGIAFLIAFVAFNLNHLAELKEDIINYPARVKFLAEKRLIFISLIIFSSVLIFILSLSNFNLLLAPLFAFTIIVLYTIKWVPSIAGRFLRFRRLKEIPFIKTFLAAFSAAGCTYLLVFFSSQQVLLGSALGVLSLFFFLRIFIASLAFDVRDIEGDARFNIRTFPVLLGHKKALFLLCLLNSFSFALYSSLALQKLVPFTFFWVNLIITIYSFMFIYLFTTKFDKKVLCDVIVDGEYILAGILSLLIFKILF